MPRLSNLMSSLPGKAEAPPRAETPTDYLDLYGLSKPPFSVADDSRNYILFNSHRRVFEVLVDHLINGKGFILLGGEAGAGKSQMLIAAGHLAAESGLRVIKLTPPTLGKLDAPELLAAIVGDSTNVESGEPGLQAAIRCFFVAPRAVLLIDDLDRLTADCFPILAAIAQQAGPAMVMTSAVDFQNHVEQLGLAGLARAEFQIPRLGPAEVRQYIERSLWIAGATTRRLLTPDALRLIVATSDGLPGSINRLMETTLTAGFARGESLITARTVAATLAPSTRRKRINGPRWSGIAAQATAVGMLLIGAGAFLYQGLDGASAPKRQPSPSRPSPKMIQLKTEPPAAPAEVLSPDLVDALMKRGEQSLGLGDIAAARLLFQRAAEAGNPQAATAVGKTYDPAFPVAGANPARAAEWYRKAISLGDQSANDLLKRLQSSSTGPNR